jgi:hypothetical protein
VRKETFLKLYNTSVLPTFLYVLENWTLTASQRQRIEAAEMKLLSPLTGHTFNDQKTNDSTRRELQTECILDRIQKELAFTPAKNATKPNHFKIIPLQFTGKENNWETEETLARAALTVETERAK